MLTKQTQAESRGSPTPCADDILRRVAACTLAIDWRAGSSLGQAGLRKSRLHGDQGDFHALKPFAPGDRVRAINWRATAATGAQLVLREVRLEEQPIDVFMIVNTGASMDFGTVRVLKRHAAAEVTAVVALSAMQGKDRLGSITYSEQGVQSSFPARSPQQHALPAIGAVLDNDRGAVGGVRSAAGLTISGAALGQALSLLPRRRSLVFIASDFFECDADENRAALEYAAAVHQLVAIHIEDPRENELPDRFGIVSLTAIGGMAQKTVLLTGQSRRRFAQQACDRKAELQRLFERLSVPLVTICTAEQPETYADRLQVALEDAC